MKLIEPTHKTEKKNDFLKLSDQIRQIIPFGKKEDPAEDAILARFLKGMDNRFFLLYNLQLENIGPPFPPIVAGPTGVYVLNISSEKGFFKAKDDSWWKMDKTTHRFNPGRPNLLKQSQEYAKKLTTILDVHGKAHPEIIPLLIFANPGVHIETSNPAIRPVLMDGVDSLIGTILNNDEVLTPNEINFLADALEVLSDPDKAIPIGEGEDFFGRDLFEPEKKAPPKMLRVKTPDKMSLSGVEEKLQFNQKQWFILIGLLILTIVLLFGAILFSLSGM